MLQFPEIDPVIASVGPVKIHWYGAMYLFGFMLAWWIGTRRARQPGSPFRPEQIEDVIFYGALGVVLGGRIGYVLFYGFDQLLVNPLWLFKVWEGGMSFHGGLLGVFAALIYYARRQGLPLGQVCDFVAPLAPLGLGLGRLANFINAELYGRSTDMPWAMVFPTDPRGLPRHPSQLYQFALEGVLLFLVLIWFARRPRPNWSVTGLFLLMYGAARFFVEFFREPDAGIGFDLFGWMTRGQLLSLPMIIGGSLMLWWAMSKPATPPQQFELKRSHRDSDTMDGQGIASGGGAKGSRSGKKSGSKKRRRKR